MPNPSGELAGCWSADRYSLSALFSRVFPHFSKKIDMCQYVSQHIFLLQRCVKSSEKSCQFIFFKNLVVQTFLRKIKFNNLTTKNKKTKQISDN